MKRLEELLERSAYYYYAAKDYETSIRLYNKLLDEFPDSKFKDKYISDLGWIYHLLKDYKRVKECIEILKKRYPDSHYKLDYLEKIVNKKT